jgi:tetratricopeptide (TPR) repeat protein
MPPASAQRREVSDVLHAIPGGLEWAAEGFHMDVLVVESRDAILTHYSDHAQLMMIQAGCYRDQMPSLVKFTEEALQAGRLAEASLLYTVQARCLAALGEFERSQEAFARSTGLSERFRTVPFLELQQGAYPLEYRVARGEHIELLADGIAASLSNDATENSWVLAVMRALTAAAMAIAGREEEAMRYYHEALPAVEAAGGWAVNYPFLTGTMAATLWNIERTDQIDVLQRNIMEKVIGPDFRYIHYDGRMSMAWLSALQEHWDESIVWFAKARVVLEEEGARPLRARVDFEEARMYMRRGAPGDRERAIRLIEVATERFRALGMDGWIPRAEDLASTLR